MGKNNKNKDTLKNLSLISQLGISIVIPIILGVYIGQYIDKWLKTKGIFAIVFMLLGMGGGFMNFLKTTGLWKGKGK